MIYLDNASTTPLDPDVLDAMTVYLKEEFGNPSSQHSAGRKTAVALLDARDKIAALAGCSSDEIYFTSGGTEAGNWALKGVCACCEEGLPKFSFINGSIASSTSLSSGVVAA